MGSSKLHGNWVKQFLMFFPHRWPKKQRSQSPSSAASSPDLLPWDFLRNLFFVFFVIEWQCFSFSIYQNLQPQWNAEWRKIVWANTIFMCWLCVRKTCLRPVANLLGALHGVPCIDDVIGLERHHGLHLQQCGVDESVVHALAGSAKGSSASSVTNVLQMGCGQCFLTTLPSDTSAPCKMHHKQLSIFSP